MDIACAIECLGGPPALAALGATAFVVLSSFVTGLLDHPQRNARGAVVLLRRALKRASVVTPKDAPCSFKMLGTAGPGPDDLTVKDPDRGR